MKYLIIILIIFGCNKDEVIEPFDQSFYLHGGDFKVWKQLARTRTENGIVEDQQPGSLRWIFYSDNIFAISSDLDNKGLWVLDGNDFTIIMNGVPIEYEVLLLKDDEFALKFSCCQGIIFHQTWVPL